MGDDLGDRIKRYENAYKHRMTPRSPVVIRVDGRAFHTYTRGMNKPFDRLFMQSMREATAATASELSGFKLAYTQSDEANFLIADTDRHTTQGWFDYELNKIVSISASAFTYHFNRSMMETGRPALFDSRAFVVPADDAPNAFIWRQRDWERNSISMLAQAHFSHRELQGKKIADMHNMLHGIGINWAKLGPAEKNGTFILRDGTTREEKADYTMIAEWLTPVDDRLDPALV